MEIDYQCKPTFLDYVDVQLMPDILLQSISINEQNNGPENEVYFYHGDHLGSANWITDYTGAPIQYIHYAPYGELIDNQQAATPKEAPNYSNIPDIDSRHNPSVQNKTTQSRFVDEK